MSHNGIDIDQFILLTVYPTITFFVIGIIAKRISLGEPLKYASQASSCVIFAAIYLLTIPNGGAHGLAVVLILFGAILFMMARKYMMHPKGEEESPLQRKEEEGDRTEKTSPASPNENHQGS